MRWLPAALWMLLVVVAASLFALLAWFVLHDRLDPAVKEAVVLTVERPGGYVLDDLDAQSALAGDLRLDETSVAVGPCHSLLGHAGDWGVGPAAVVSERADLVRVAELVASGRFDVDTASQIEAVLPDADEAPASAPEIARSTTVRASVVEDYLAERSQPPSDEAMLRYSVYLQNQKLKLQRLVFVDRNELTEVDFQGLPGQYSSVPFVVAGTDEIDELTKDDCQRLIASE